MIRRGLKLSVWLCSVALIAAVHVRAEEWGSVGGAAQPPVWLASDGAKLSFRVDPLEGATPSARLVAARTRTRRVSIDGFPYVFDLAGAGLGEGDLRLYLRVTWTNPDGSVRRAETYFSPALGDREPESRFVMKVFDLDAFVASCEAAKSRIMIPFEMPSAGRATVVLDDADGRRVRNLVNAGKFAAGANRVEWDGRREDGTVASAGTYRVRVVTQRGVEPEFLGSFANGGENLWAPYGPNHSPFRSLVAGPDGLVSASSYFTEGGDSTVVLRSGNGAKTRGWSEIWDYGNEALFHVSGAGNMFYSVREGHVSSDGVTKSVFQIYAYRWDASRRPAVHVELADASALPGQPNAFRVAAAPASGEPTLTGAALKDGYLYVGDRLEGGRVLVYRVLEDFTWQQIFVQQLVAVIPLTDVGALCVSQGRVLAASGGTIFAVDENGTATQLFTVATGARPDSMASDGENLYCLHSGHHLVYVYGASDGGWVKTIGTSDAGDYVGLWDRDRLVNPTSLCIDANGALWVTENRMNPKRLSRWNTATGKCEYEKLGSEKYGSPGAGMDGDDPTHWIAENCEWLHDPANGEDRVVATLFPETRRGDGSWNAPPNEYRSYKWVRRAGRTFVIANDANTTLYEYRDHRLIPLALVSTPGIFADRLLGRAEVCRPMVDAYRARFPWTSEHDCQHDEMTPMLWRDLDRDGLMDADEFEFGELGTAASFGYWGETVADLDFLMTVARGQEVSVLSFKAGSLQGDSLPDWSLSQALANAKTTEVAMPEGGTWPEHHESYGDADFTITASASPYLLGWTADGDLRWTMKSIFATVHGSHDAPLPEYGKVQSILFAIGSFKLADGRTVVAFQNNHGLVYLITTDGLFLAQLFTDCRVAARNDETLIGGEAYGGSVACRPDGTPILQAGGGGCRLYALKGLDTLAESASEITVDDAAIAAAVRLNPTEEERDWSAPTLSVPYRAEGSRELVRIAEWSSGYHAIRLDGSWNEARLRLRYTVEEPSPWVNNGRDPYLMFKTGDCVDLQLGVEGLRRLQVSPGAGGSGTSAVLYRHTLPAGVSGTPHTYSSPTRSYTVADVGFRSDVGVDVSVSQGRYQVTLDIPHAVTGLDGSALAGQSVSGDFGVIFGDAAGEIDLSRVYWSNKSTGIVNDVPDEIIPQSAKWGTVVFAPPESGGVRDPLADLELDVVFTGYLGNPGGFRAAKNENDPEFYDRPFTVGPVYDASRGVLFAGGGTGRVSKFLADGTLLATYHLPDAPPYSRFDAILQTDDDGSLIVLAGGSISQKREETRSGRLYRIRPDWPDGASAEVLSPGVPVNAISSSSRGGYILLHRRSGEIYAYRPSTGDRREIASAQIPDGLYTICLMDWLDDDGFIVVRGHKELIVYRPDGSGRYVPEGSSVTLFGDRDLGMERGRLEDGMLWSFSDDTAKRLDGRSFLPAPGVVHGGSSGYFIGNVTYNAEMQLCGIARIAEDVYAVSATHNGAVYLMHWDAASEALEESARLGTVPTGSGLALDGTGCVYADGLVWWLGDDAFAPPRAFGSAPDGLAPDPFRTASVEDGAVVVRTVGGDVSARITGLDDPGAAVVRGADIVVWERGAQRLSTYRLIPHEPPEVPTEYLFSGGETTVAFDPGEERYLDFVRLENSPSVTFDIPAGTVVRASEKCLEGWYSRLVETDYGWNTLRLTGGGVFDLNGGCMLFWHDGNAVEVADGTRLTGFHTESIYHDEGYRNAYTATEGGVIEGARMTLFAASGDTLSVRDGTVALSEEVVVAGDGTVSVAVGATKGMLTLGRIVREDGSGTVALALVLPAGGRGGAGPLVTFTSDDPFPAGAVSLTLTQPPFRTSAEAVPLVRVARPEDAARLRELAASVPAGALAGGGLSLSADGMTLVYTPDPARPLARYAASADDYEINVAGRTPYTGGDPSVNALLPGEVNLLRGLVPERAFGSIRAGYGTNGTFWEPQTSDWGALTDGEIPLHPREGNDGVSYDELADERYLVPDGTTLSWSFPASDLKSVRFWTQWPDGCRTDIAVASIEVLSGGCWYKLPGSAFCSGKNVDAVVANTLEPSFGFDCHRRRVTFAAVDYASVARNVTGLRIVFPAQELGYTCHWELEAEKSVAPVFEAPRFTDSSRGLTGGVALGTSDGHPTLSLTIVNAAAGASYTAFVCDRLTSDLSAWTAVTDSTVPVVDGLLTLDFVRDDAPSLFVRLVASSAPVMAGTRLSEILAR